MSKVFIPNKGGYDYTDATGIGELVFLTEGFQRLNNTSAIYSLFVEQMEQSTGDDYLLISGPGFMNAIAAAILTIKHGRLNLLLHVGGGKYVRRNLKIDSLLQVQR